MSLAQKTEKKYTYKDYLEWPDDERWELIDGVAYNMTPAPLPRHQRIVGMFYHILINNLKDKPCIPFIAPTDVVLSEYDVVQPDVFVVCDKKKITKTNIQGAPDLVVEVLSPSTTLKDKREKKACFEKYGVREYIIIDPIENYVERFYLEDDGSFSKGNIFGPKEVLPLSSIEGIEISLSEVFYAEEEAE
ncbi:MAG: Uma2 family endonuclease [Nitrospinota bacterium]